MLNDSSVPSLFSPYPSLLSLPALLDRVGVPPIKCQGIKTKLVPFIASQIRWQEQRHARWIEPFLGSGVVALNLLPSRALLADANPHIIRFYQAIQERSLTGTIAQDFLRSEGETLQRLGADYYYEVRDRFNRTGLSLDFLFLNRACFNGLMRFNRKGGFNVPFCRKPQRFSQRYITKIVNQIDWVARQLADKDWEFRVARWRDVLLEVTWADFVYLDPPYIGRHADYYSTWDRTEAETLAVITRSLPCGFAASMWLENRYRKNTHVQDCWADLEVRTRQHFYHVGSKESWRGAVAEVLLIKPGFALPAEP